MNDSLISRQAAIEALERIMSDYPLDGYEDERLLINALKDLPPAQPELIEKAAYIRGFEQGRTQGMIDAQGGKKFATDAVIRYAAIDAIEKCYTCKHVYQRVSDADTLYCRCRKGCRYEEFKPKRSGESPRRHEG
jgi:hypothetical protein